MSKRGNRLPAGFGGTVRSFQELQAPSGRALVLPRQAAQLRQGLRFDRIVFAPLSESMGRVEDAMASVAGVLEDGGTLVLEVENRQSLRQLRFALEGRAGGLQTIDALEDPGQALPLRRVLNAVASAGLCPRDVVQVDGWDDVGPEFAGTVFRQGFVPTAWLDGAPPARFWLVADRVPSLAGSVLIGPGSRAAQEKTASALRAFLPDSWEIVRAAGGTEAEGFNRAVVAAQGEILWFLRAGAVPAGELFTRSWELAEIGPVAPGTDGQRGSPGDLSGLMLSRLDVLLTGPIGEQWRNDGVAGEDWSMRLDCCASETALVESELASPPPPVAAPDCFAAEAEAMIARWQPIAQGKAAWDSDDDPASRRAGDRAVPWAGRQPRVSLCMIARNEERFLPECLAAVRDAVDEIVVVDTGSTDRTVAIAESFGAKVLYETWDDDFSAPRNTGLGAVTGDWILVLDADETLGEGAAQRIRELVKDPGVCGYHMRFTNAYGNGKTLGVMMVRLFRNLPGVAYHNVIHEQITPSLMRIGAQQGLVLSLADIEVTHYGYTEEIMGARNKNERNERLFKKQLARQPDDIYALYKYGDFLRRMGGRQREARELLEQCLELILAGPPQLPRELPYAGEVAALCALEYAREDRHERAREIIDTALRRFVPTPNLHYIAASLDLQAGRNDDAIAHFRRCLSYRGQVLVVPIQDGITGHVALAGMAQAWLQKGDLDRAQRMLERAIALQPQFEPSHLALSRLHITRADPGAALRVLTEYLAAHPDAAGACQQTTLILHRLGLKEQARRMGERALSLLQAGAMDHEAEHMRRILAALD